MKLFHVTTRVVDLIWADGATEAARIGREILQGRGFEVLDAEVFVSEPVESMGWAGE